jgi:NAD+ synthase (glutamine-hydrolysing)
MSHYAVNASVPKTVIAHVIRWVAETGRLGPDTGELLRGILSSTITPELVPGELGGHATTQDTESVVGPYELQDFNLYYILRYGFAPPKVAFLSWCSWHELSHGDWPDIPSDKRRAYDLPEIKRVMRIFLERFFKFSQFKRTCIPNSPKIGSGGSLSPRGDYRAPSDSEAIPWLQQLDLVPNDE